MLDAISAFEGQLKPPKFDTKYSADQAIMRVDYLTAPTATRLTVLFPAWHMPTHLTSRLQRELLDRGSSSLAYTFNPLILEKDIIKVKSSFEFIALSIAQDIAVLEQRQHFESIDLLGISVGNVALSITAEKLKRFDAITMVVPGSELAGSLWAGWRTRRLRNALSAEGYKLLDLQNEWEDLAPEAHISMLRHHQVHLILAKKDHFIPFNFGQRLYDELKAVNPRTTCAISRFGHVATILRYQPERITDNASF